MTAFQRRLSVRGQKLGTKIWLKERFKDYLPFQNKFCKFVDVFFIRYIHKNYEMSSNEVGCMLVQKKMKPDEVPAPATVRLCDKKLSNSILLKFSVCQLSIICSLHALNSHWSHFLRSIINTRR